MSTDLLTVDNVSVAFSGLKALDAVSLSVSEGSVVGLIGPNGAGKTTLLNVISGFQKPTDGRIFFGGRDVTHLAPDRRAGLGVGRSFQNLGLMMEETVEDNILAAQHDSSGYRLWDPLVRPHRWRTAEVRMRRRADKMLGQFELAGHRESRVGSLSFATARFVELACVMTEDRRLLLLDEPTTGLDTNEVDRLLQVIEELRNQNITVLVVAHDVRFTMTACDHVYVLAGGRVLFDGPPTAVSKEPSVIEAYLGTSSQ